MQNGLQSKGYRVKTLLISACQKSASTALIVISIQMLQLISQSLVSMMLRLSRKIGDADKDGNRNKWRSYISTTRKKDNGTQISCNRKVIREDYKKQCTTSSQDFLFFQMSSNLYFCPKAKGILHKVEMDKFDRKPLNYSTSQNYFIPCGPRWMMLKWQIGAVSLFQL